MDFSNSVGFIQDGLLFINANGWICFCILAFWFIFFVRLADVLAGLFFVLISKIKDWRRKKCDSKK